MYVEWPSEVAGAIVWRSVVGDESPSRVLPDGCLDLLWANGTLMVAGPDTHAYEVAAAHGAVFAGVRFAPGTGAPVLGVRADEVRDTHLPLDVLLPAATVRRLTDQVAVAADPAVELERIATDWHRARSRRDPLIGGVVAGLSRGVSVAATAAAAGMTERTLHRRCLPAFGYGPKTLGRILRLNRALGMARSGVPFALVAANAGYADQAHLARDVKDLVGMPLGALLSQAA
jgi:AraC-like DNA-binding protein